MSSERAKLKGPWFSWDPRIPSQKNPSDVWRTGSFWGLHSDFVVVVLLFLGSIFLIRDVALPSLSNLGGQREAEIIADSSSVGASSGTELTDEDITDSVSTADGNEALEENSEGFSFNDVLPFASIFIYILGGWGVIVGIRYLSRLTVEHALSLEMDNTGNEELKRIRGQNSKLKLEDLEQTINPYRQGAANFYVVRLAQHIINDAKDRKFDSVSTLLYPYMSAFVEKEKDVYEVLQQSLRAGILGTFIGLILAFQQLSESISSGNNNLVQLLQPIFDDLYLAFSTSMAGLHVALGLGFVVILLKRKTENFFESLEKSTVTVSSLAYNATYTDANLNELKRVTNEVGRIVRVNDQLNSKISEISKTVTKQNEAIRDTLSEIPALSEKTQEFITDLLKKQTVFEEEFKKYHEQFIGDLTTLYDEMKLGKVSTDFQKSVKANKEQQSQFLNELKTLVKVLEPTQVTKAFNESLGTLGGNMLTEMKAHGTTVSTQFNNSLRTNKEQQDKFITELKEFIKSIDPKVITQTLEQSVKDLGKPIGESLKTEIEGLSTNVNKFASQIPEVTGAITKNSDTIRDKTSKLLQEVQDQNTAIRDGLSRLSDLKEEYDNFIDKLENNQATFVDDVKSVYDIISLKDMSADLKDNLIEVNDVTDSISKKIKNIKSKNDRSKRNGRASKMTQQFQTLISKLRISKKD